MIVSFPTQIVNPSEPEILHFISAYNKNNQQYILGDHIIPKSTELAITILNTSENPVNASLKLKNLSGSKKLVQLIDPNQTEQFCFEVLEDCTLGDFELRISKKANKDLGDSLSLKRKKEDSDATDSNKEKEASAEESSLKKSKTEGTQDIPNVTSSNNKVIKEFPLDTCLWDHDSNKRISWGQEVLEGRKLGVRIRNPHESTIKVICRAFSIDKTRIPSKGVGMTFLNKMESIEILKFVPREEDKIVKLRFLFIEVPRKKELAIYELTLFIPIIANKAEIRTA